MKRFTNFTLSAACLALLASYPLAASAEPCQSGAPDADGDTICDANDPCVNDATVPVMYSTDWDGDGVLCNDACPTNSTKNQSTGMCGCGVNAPEPDIDQDSVVDCRNPVSGQAFDQCPYDQDKQSPGVCGCNQEENEALCTDRCQFAINARAISGKISRTSRAITYSGEILGSLDRSCLSRDAAQGFDPETDETYNLVAEGRPTNGAPFIVGPAAFEGNRTSLRVPFKVRGRKTLKRGAIIRFFVQKAEPEEGGNDEYNILAECRLTSNSKAQCRTAM